MELYMLYKTHGNWGPAYLLLFWSWQFSPLNIALGGREYVFLGYLTLLA